MDLRRGNAVAVERKLSGGASIVSNDTIESVIERVPHSSIYAHIDFRLALHAALAAWSANRKLICIAAIEGNINDPPAAGNFEKRKACSQGHTGFFQGF